MAGKTLIARNPFRTAGGSWVEKLLLDRVLPTFLPTVVVLLLALATTSVLGWLAWKEAERSSRMAFLRAVGDVTSTISDTLLVYEQSLRAGAGLIHAVGEINSRDWSIFVQSLELARRSPGMQGLGVARIVRPADEVVGSGAQSQRAEAQPIAVERRPTAPRTAIVFLEPLDWRNKRAIGYDMMSEPVRRAAMERARDTGEPVMSRPVTLKQETTEDVQPGTLIYFPFFTGGSVPGDVAERRERLAGFVYVVLRLGDFFTLALGRADPPPWLRLQIEDNDGHASTSLPVFDNEGIAGKGVSPAPISPRAVLTADRRIDAAGARWTLRASSPAAAWAAPGRPGAWLWLILGLGSTVAITAIAALLDYSRYRYAAMERWLHAEVSERTRAEEEARLANEELIHRVKNSLAIVSAIATQTARHSASVAEFSKAFGARIAGLARLQDLLRPNAAYAPMLSSFVADVLSPYIVSKAAALHLEGPTAEISQNDATLLSLLLNELATNATKHGAWSVPAGRVELTWRFGEVDGCAMVILEWVERGGPPVMPPTRSGFGTSVMKMAVERGLKGRLVSELAPEGVRHEIAFPRQPGSAPASVG
jgi:two-component sensor histidine kinase/CHASE1-domain containing sensor protein